jgi:hypothetical protein
MRRDLQPIELPLGDTFLFLNVLSITFSFINVRHTSRVCPFIFNFKKKYTCIISLNYYFIVNVFFKLLIVSISLLKISKNVNILHN